MSYEPTSKRLVVTEITPTPESDSALEVTNAMGGGGDPNGSHLVNPNLRSTAHWLRGT